MKLTRSQFKGLMKECLTELINEGMFDKHLEKLTEGRQAKPSAPVNMLYGNGNARPTPPSGLEQGASGEINPRLMQAVQNVVSQTPSGKKSMFEQIMMDTAINTLQKQIAGGDGFGSASGLSQEMPIAPEVAAHDNAQLQALAGGNVSRWATAAFGGKKR